MDQWMRPIFMGDDEINDLADQTEQIRMQYRNFQTESLRRMLGMTFDEIYVVPNFVWDERQMSEEIITRFTAPEGMEGTGIASQHVASRAQMEGSPSGWEPGLQNNAAAMPNYLMPGGGIMSASQSEFARNYFVDSSVLEIITGSGGVIPERSTVAATATWNRNLRQVDWINATPEGEDPRTNDDWEVFKNENSNPRRLNGDLDAYALAEFHELVASAMGVPIDNVTLHIQERLIFIDTEHVPLELATILMVIVLLLLLAMLLYGLLRKQRAAGEDEEALEPQLAVEDLLVSTQLEEAREEETQQLEEIDYFKENEVKRHIEKFVNEKPEAVAALLRNWINVEEW
jgi:flagellar M-ring protein FliF